ncbi:hypothetical protein UA08_03448 [Talaromyces atroroseus]|uniref:Fibroin-3 related protein n=1 Tax=Talaromyces atroroseus TaxID=1441469 RepID=A0A225ASB1_TALAT|nr:hypothetical protein UA08_03448 [Talaromyces atroroseus]OKL61244.1 hypothetical protein UA08_03448 [Talaromyces atroroseus]
MSVTEKMVASLVQRSLSNDVSSALTSWDSCMAKAYCKWPVIAGIIVGSIIILGIAGCLISCLCCGYRCCEGCCGCCYRCCDCGGSRHNRRRGNKYVDEPPPQPYYQQPPPPEPMNFGYRQPVAAASSLASTAPPPAYRGPQTATFDQPSKPVVVNEDELPPMPTWADAQTRRVEDPDAEHEEVEMDNLAGIRDQSKSPFHHDAVAPAPVAGGLSRGMSRGGYTQVPANYPSPHPSPRPLYDEGYSPNGGVGGYGGHGEYQDGYHNEEQGNYYGSPADAHYFNQDPHSLGTGFGQLPAGYSPRALPQPSPAPYRGFDNQPPPRAPVPNFSAPGNVYGGQIPSPRSPPPAMGAGYSPYDQQSQQYRQLTHSPPPPAMHPAMQPSSMGSGYSPYDHDQLPQQQPSSGYSPYDHQTEPQYGVPQTHSPPPPQPTLQQQQQGGQYRAFSPRIASPGPPSPHQATAPTSLLEDPSANNEDRPPSLLMAGRRPAPNSYRAV